jgi:hypothetical protein
MNLKIDQRLMPRRSDPLKTWFVASGPRRNITLMIARLTRNTSPCSARFDLRKAIGSMPNETALPIRGRWRLAVGIVVTFGGMLNQYIAGIRTRIGRMSQERSIIICVSTSIMRSMESPDGPLFIFGSGTPDRHHCQNGLKLRARPQNKLRSHGWVHPTYCPADA